jgi:ParB family chromosome partitioning protein
VGKSRNYVNEILSVAEIPVAWIERAKAVGIESKNLFIQFAQAVKSGAAENFLNAYQSGSVKTVAAAKQFNKTQKAPGAQKATQMPIVRDLQCVGETKDKRWRFTIDFSTLTAGTADKVRQLEKALSEQIRKQLR